MLLIAVVNERNDRERLPAPLLFNLHSVGPQIAIGRVAESNPPLRHFSLIDDPKIPKIMPLKPKSYRAIGS
jgi:hypothetical protein